MGNRNMDAQALYLFFRQLALLLSAGFGSGESLQLMLEEGGAGEARALFTQLKNLTDGGQPLSAAMAQSAAFPAYAVELTAAGEATGRMEAVYKALSAHYEREAKLEAAIGRVLGYPLFLGALAALVVFALVGFVLPVFERVIFGLAGGAASGAAAAAACKWAAVVLAALLLVAVIFVFFRSRSGEGRVSLRKRLDQLFLGSSLEESMARERVASAMALQLAGGADFSDALAFAVRLCETAGLRQKLEQAGQLLTAGETFSYALEKSRVFSGMEAALLRAAFRSGETAFALEELANRAHSRSEELLDRLLGRLEPALILVLALAVGLVLLSVLLPLLSVL